MSGFMNGRSEHEALGYRWLLKDSELVERNIILNGVWEPESTAIVRRFLRPGDVFCDVGANIGYYTLLAAQIVGRRGRVVAVEAMAEPAAILAANVFLNGLSPWVTLLPFALADRPRLAGDGTPFHYSCPWPAAAEDRRVHPVTYVTLDSIAAAGALPELSFLKVDTDGYEAHVLRGGRYTLEQQRPLVLVEVGDWTLRHAAGIPEEGYTYGTATREMLALLTACGYRLYREDTLAPVSADELLAAYPLDRSTTNVFAVPEERRAEVSLP